MSQARKPAPDKGLVAATGSLVDQLKKLSQDDLLAALPIWRQLVARREVETIVEMLPLLLQLNGQPYTLDGHFHFEDRFRLRYAAQTIWCTARQVGKSTGQGSAGLVRCASTPAYSLLYVTPLFEQVRRFSSQVVGPFINQSPIKQLLIDTNTNNSVLFRGFANGAKMNFTFAGLDVDRVRGVAADENSLDEIQDLNREHIPIIAETMSASKYEISTLTGTPKTKDNVAWTELLKSSHAEWFIPCTHCTTNGFRTWNIPSIDHHLFDMLGPYRDDISRERPALICHKCGQWISPRHGRWVHRHPERRWTYAGHHIPQPVVPLHCETPNKWASLLAKQAGARNYTTAKFINEVLGEAYDESSLLVTQTDLQNAATLHPNEMEAARRRSKTSGYICTVLGVDWGGGGDEEISWTAMALLGMRPNGQIDVLWGQRLLTPNDHLREAKAVKDIWNYFKPDVLAHDYNGSGSIRETLLNQAGVKISQIMPLVYVRAATSAPVYHVPPTEHHPRHHYRADKTRLLLLVCGLIRLRWINTFQYDHRGDDHPGLLHDFLALIQEKTATIAGDVYRIDRREGTTDDFAHAVTFGCAALWHRTKRWPNLIDISAYRATEDKMRAIDGDGGNWINDEDTPYEDDPDAEKLGET